MFAPSYSTRKRVCTYFRFRFFRNCVWRYRSVQPLMTKWPLRQAIRLQQLSDPTTIVLQLLHFWTAIDCILHLQQQMGQQMQPPGHRGQAFESPPESRLPRGSSLTSSMGMRRTNHVRLPFVSPVGSDFRLGVLRCSHPYRLSDQRKSSSFVIELFPSSSSSLVFH